jgi:hypothetical protein
MPLPAPGAPPSRINSLGTSSCCGRTLPLAHAPSCTDFLGHLTKLQCSASGMVPHRSFPWLPEAANQPDLLGLRDRALIAMMVCSFARIGAVIQMKVGDNFVQGRRRWVRLHEKGGKEHDVPCHHRLDQCLHDYIEAPASPMTSTAISFRTARRKTGQLTTNPLFQQDAHRIISPTRESGRHRDADWQSYLSCDRHHGVSEEQR